MSPGILYALLSLAFAGINDILFKKYSVRKYSIGMYVFGIGVTWTALQMVWFHAAGVPTCFNSATITCGLIAGLVLTVSNILFLESLMHINISLGSTIYRLNTIAVVILSFFFLYEPLGLLKMIGIVFGIFAVLLLYDPVNNNIRSAGYSKYFFIVVMASLFRAFYGIITKFGIISSADYNAMLLIISATWVAGGAAYALIRERSLLPSASICVYSLVSGILVFLIANFLMLAIVHGDASIVIPVANMSFVLALLISTLLKMESISMLKAVSVCCAVVSILLLSQV